MKIFSAQLKGTTIVVEGATASLTGSFTGSVAGIDINATNTFTASTIARLNSIETISSSNDGRVNSLESFTSSTSARLNSIETISASNLSRLGSLEAKTGSLASTGSNTFIGTQTITGSLYISSDLIVQGSSSLQNITASAVSIGTNLINLNTANPAIRYAGLVIGDSGSVGGSGSFLYDSVQDEMLFIHRGGSTVVTSSVTLMGPETYDDLGNETYLTNNRLPKGKGNEHLADSNISDSGTLVTINSVTSSFTGVVGMGTTTPSRNLHVASSGTDTTIAATKTGTDSSQIGVDSVAYIGAGGDLTIRAGGFTSATEKVRVTTGGNVGVGATNPQQILSVNNPFSSLNTLYPIAISQAGNAELAGIYSTADSITNPIGAGLAFKTYHINVGLSEKVRIANSGNVGIGITNPSYKLDVVGDIHSTSELYLDNGYYLRFKRSSGGLSIQTLGIPIGTDDVRLLTTGDFNLVNGSLVNLMTVKNGGNIGIGTTNPGNKLHVYDANVSGTDDIVRAYQNVTTNHAWYRSQRNGGANMLLGATRDNVDGNIPADVSIIWNNSNHAMAFGTNNTERIRILAGGNVGIGYTAPTVRLQVSGSIAVGDNVNGWGRLSYDVASNTTRIQSSKDGTDAINLSFWTQLNGGSFGERMIISGSSVGIGNTNPKTRLQVTPQSNAEVPVLGTATGVAIFTSANTNYGLQFNSTSDGSFHMQSQRFDNSATSYALVLQPAGGTVAINGNSSQAALHIGEADTRKISYIGNHSIRRTNLFKTFNQGSTTDYWARISLNNSYADTTQGVYGTITVAWHPFHASMGRYYQYRIFQSPYTANNSYMKIQTVFEEVFGWDYYSFSSDVTFYNYQSYLYIKITGTNASYAWARSIQAELTGGSYAMDNVNLEVGVSAPASLSGIITKNGSAALSG